MGGLFGGKDGGSQPSQTTATRPPGFQLPFIQEAFQGAQDLFRSDAPSFFPQSTVVPPNPLQNLASAGILDFAAGPGQAASSDALNALRFGLTDVLDPASNPYLQQFAEGAIRPIFQQLTEGVLPAIRSGARAVGGQGGSRQGIAEGLATSRATQQAGDITSRIFSDAYGQGLSQQAKALALAPQTIGQTGILPEQLTAAVGEDFSQYQQALLQDAISRHQFEQNKPFMKLNEFFNIVGQGQGGVSKATSQPGEASDLDAALGIALQALPAIIGLF